MKNDNRTHEIYGGEYVPKTTNHTNQKICRGYKTFKNRKSLGGETLEGFIGKMSHPYSRCEEKFYKMDISEMKNILDKVFEKEQKGEYIETIFIPKNLILFQNQNGDDTITERGCDKGDYRLWIK